MLVGDDGVPLEIVHCDVSPENLIVGIDGVCRLTDFGVAKHGPGTGEREQVTHGKPGHLAPEQILGHRVDRRADIFSLGVVLYNALTGTKLFEAPTLEETLERTCTRRIEPPSTVGLRPPPSLDFVCMKALEREPERRFDTAEEMMMELRRIALRENLLAPTNDIAGWVRESVGRELTQRRLALLDASRRAPSAPAPARVEGGAHDAPKTSAAAAAAASDFRPERDAPESRREGKERDNMTHTIVLQPASGAGRRWALISASVLAAAAVLATLLWPNTVSKMFRLNTDRISAPTTLDADAGKLNTGAAGMSGMQPAAGAQLPQPSTGSPRP
jgi:serine/threonine-protein kinase